MIFKCGIIGLPNVGKSTFFNLLTNSSAKSENFPFCTIKSNKGFMPIFDIRLYQLSKISKINHIIHGNIELVDIAGLIKGASCGEGLGNRFLNDISEVDVLLHVVRCFNNQDVCHINNDINPQKDIEIVHDELILSDISLCEKKIILLEKNKRCNKYRDMEKLLKFFKKILMYLYDKIMLYNVSLDTEEIIILKSYNFLTFKPIVYIANIGTDNKDNDYLLELSNFAINTNIPYISFCVLSEEKLEKLKKYNILSDINSFDQYIKNSKFFDIINIIYQILQLKTFFTINMQSVEAWITYKNAVAIDVSNMIHSDFKKNFIRVQIVQYRDFIVYQGWNQAKKFGRMKIEGKKYLIQEGDVLKFLI